MKVNKNAYILRLGWQIDSKECTHPNNMVSYILREKNENNEIYANSNSYISASFNSDVAKKIVEISLGKQPNVYLLNSNLNLNFYELLNKVVDKYGLEVKVIEEFGETKNWIMIDPTGYIPWDL